MVYGPLLSSRFFLTSYSDALSPGVCHKIDFSLNLCNGMVLCYTCIPIRQTQSNLKANASSVLTKASTLCFWNMRLNGIAYEF